MGVIRDAARQPVEVDLTPHHVVHLHGPVSGPVCGAPWPTDRQRWTTAYRSEVTCRDCLPTLPSTTKVCEVCGIGTRFLPLAGDGGAYIHAEPRTLANNLHNGTPDHNAVVTR